ncbi:hypothetical protein EC988_003715 [Linderina pennispora]|nr:hypothetical protein EC988_003715 [Linderina pennispora]
MAVISWFGWPLPLHIEWTNLNNLNFSASIATKDGIANLIVQLPVLQFIKIDCESMCIDDAAASAFPDQANRNTMAIYTLRARKSSPISQCLEQFHIISQKNFDIEGFCELVALLPRIARIKVNFYHVQDVQAMLPRYVEAARSIDISAYPYAF